MVRAPTIEAVIPCSKLIHDSGDLKYHGMLRVLSLILFHVTSVLDIRHFDAH